MRTKQTDIYVIKVGDRLYGPFKQASAAVAWAMREIPLAGWTMARVTAP